MAKLSPSFKLMFVNASFLRTTGRVIPADTIPCEKSSDETSGRICRLIVSPSRTTGVKMRPTPNGFHSMLTVPSPEETGNGNSPPDRNLASRPLSVTRFGLASVRMRLRWARARTTPA